MELLEYLSPTDGRPIPDDQRPNDLAHWQTEVQVRSLAELGARLDSAGVPRVSRQAVTPGSRNPGEARGVLVKDPDGHVVQLVDR